MKAAADNPAPPSRPVKLIFIHHSSGENWLADLPSDFAGGLGVALRDNNYFVSDTNYTWGPADADIGDGTIGDHTYTGSWYNWFRGPHSSTYLSALYGESGQNCSYTRMGSDPGGRNTIVMFKSCFPNSGLGGSPSDPVPPIGSNPLKGSDTTDPGTLTVANAKGVYIDLLNYFRTRRDKLFIVITAPPLADPTYAANARAFNNWLVNDWLSGYPYKNVFVYDYYNVLTSNGGDIHANDLGSANGNHHRWWNGAVQHKTDGGGNTLAYQSSDPDHPNTEGNQKATAEFVPVLNVAYNRFKGQNPSPSPAVRQTWYLAEGCTAENFETWVLVQNPGDKPAEIDMIFQTDTGEVQGPRESVPAHTRRSYRANDYVKSFNVSTRVNSSREVVCERAVYGNGRTWAHDSIGTTAPASTWYLAEGCTAENFETWVLVQNPGDTPAAINMVFQTDTGPVQGPRETIAPKSRKTYDAGKYVTSFNVSTKVTSTGGKVVCERAVYGNGRTWAHDSIGYAP
jgi:hypothetical protein